MIYDFDCVTNPFVAREHTYVCSYYDHREDHDGFPGGVRPSDDPYWQ